MRSRSLLLPSIAELYPNSPVLQTQGASSIHTAYQSLVERATRLPDLEALVLVHEDVVLRDARLEATLRSTFADDSVAIAGVVGARLPRSLRWHDRDECYGRVEETRFEIRWRPPPADVDVLDGLFLALSPWAVRNLRFDEETFTGFHGYDGDICLQARSRNRRVVVRDIDLLHVTKGGYGDYLQFLRADRAWRTKWGRSGFTSPDTRLWDTRPPIRSIADRSGRIISFGHDVRATAGRRWRSATSGRVRTARQ